MKSMSWMGTEVGFSCVTSTRNPQACKTGEQFCVNLCSAVSAMCWRHVTFEIDFYRVVARHAMKGTQLTCTG